MGIDPKLLMCFVALYPVLILSLAFGQGPCSRLCNIREAGRWLSIGLLWLSAALVARPVCEAALLDRNAAFPLRCLLAFAPGMAAVGLMLLAEKVARYHLITSEEPVTDVRLCDTSTWSSNLAGVYFTDGWAAPALTISLEHCFTPPGVPGGWQPCTRQLWPLFACGDDSCRASSPCAWASNEPVKCEGLGDARLCGRGQGLLAALLPRASDLASLRESELLQSLREASRTAGLTIDPSTILSQPLLQFGDPKEEPQSLASYQLPFFAFAILYISPFLYVLTVAMTQSSRHFALPRSAGHYAVPSVEMRPTCA